MIEHFLPKHTSCLCSRHFIENCFNQVIGVSNNKICEEEVLPGHLRPPSFSSVLVSFTK